MDYNMQHNEQSNSHMPLHIDTNRVRCNQHEHKQIKQEEFERKRKNRNESVISGWEGDFVVNRKFNYFN